MITSVVGLRASGNRLCGKIVMFVMQAHEGEIPGVDNEYDLWLAEQRIL